MLIRNTVDVAGNLSDQESRFLGAKPLRLKLVQYLDRQCLLLLTVKTFIVVPNYPTSGNGNLEILPVYINSTNATVTLSPSNAMLSVDSIDTFNSLLCLNGFVSILGNSLKIFRCLVNGDVFSEITIPLEYTPRKLILLPSSTLTQGALNTGVNPAVPQGPVPGQLNVLLLVVESDYNSYNTEQVEEINKEMTSIQLEGDHFEPMELKNYRAGPGKWSSCIRIINPVNMETIAKLLFTENEAATAAYSCVLNGQQLLVVGTIKNAHLYPSNNGMLYIV